MNKQPHFFIGNVPIYNDLILAPMDGITDLPFRGICRELGSAMSVTEFINTIDVDQNNARFLPRLAFRDFHRPLSLQLLDDDPERLLRIAQYLVPKVQPDILDINLGCQSKNVTARGAGAALLRNPQKIGRMFSKLVKHFEIPITGKIRLGWDGKSLNYLEVAKTIQDHGGAMVAVHGRTRRQRYKGQAKWEPIAEIKQQLKIPVVGNGDVKTVGDINTIKSLTGCDGVMIGRAAISNPWIFSRLDRKQVPYPAVQKLIHTHLDQMVNFYGERGLIRFRKFLKQYLAPYAIERETILAILKSQDLEFVKDSVDEIFESLTNTL